MRNRQVTLATRPVGFPTETDFAIVEVEAPEPGPGEVLVRTRFVSLDPYQRGRMSAARSYAPPLELGDVITSENVGEVVQSNHPRLREGDLVAGYLGWQEYPTAPARRLRLLPAGLEPTSLALHAVGMTGLTAYFGLFDVGRPRAGETVAVSGAAGAVGQIVGQLAKLSGCRTVGIAGGAEKVGYLAEYGYDVGIDHRGDDVPAALEDACPDGVDLYFDNVGGELTDLVVRRLARHARVVVCGQSSQYNLSEPELGPRQLGLLIVLRARIEGFLVSDYEQRFDEGLAQLGRWVADGTLRYREDVTAGLENAPRAFIAMLHGESRGKVLIRI